MKYLVTGAAGFIGMHTAKALLERGHEVTGLDNLNDYYDVRLKHARVARLASFPGFRFVEQDIAEPQTLLNLFRTEGFARVVHLAAQAGVRYSLTNPQTYISSNLVGFANILEACRHHPVQSLVYASSSSVYGNNTKMPFAETDRVDEPISLYAATKRSNELMASTYSHLYKIPATGLRFFTVYGPWGRPDMAPFLFAQAITSGAPIKVFNNGDMLRDFTFIDDIVEGVVRLSLQDSAPQHRIFNIGNSQPVMLLEFIDLLGKNLGLPVRKILSPPQPGDVRATYADVSALEEAVGFRPQISLAEGIQRFVHWYKDYYGLTDGKQHSLPGQAM